MNTLNTSVVAIETAITTYSAEASSQGQTQNTHAQQLMMWAQGLVIGTPDVLQATIDRLAELQQAKKQAEATKEQFWRPVKDAADNLADQFNPTIKMLDGAIKLVRGKATTFEAARQEAERKRLAAEQKAREDAAIAEAARVKQAAGEAAERARLDAEAQAKQLEASGKVADAEFVRAAGVENAANIVQQAEQATLQTFDATANVAKVEQTTRTTTGAGLTVRKVWRHRVTNKAAVPAYYLMVDDAAISAAVAKGVRTIDGVEIYEEPIGAITTGRRA